MNSPLRLLNAGAFHHLPYTFVGLNLLRYLSRGLSSLAFLSSSQSYVTQTFSHPSSWFPHRLESEDHAMLWFCPKLSFPHPGSWFPHWLGSEDHAMPWFCPKPSFPHPSSWFPHRLESENHAMPWFCPKPSFLHPGSWFPH